MGELQDTVECVSQLLLHNQLRAPNSMAYKDEHLLRAHRLADNVRPLCIGPWKAGLGSAPFLFSWDVWATRSVFFSWWWQT